jgi:hypothetical protein
MHRLLGLLLVVCATSTLDAATTFTPANPTSQDRIGVFVDVPGGCTPTPTTVLTGTTIRSDLVFGGCFLGPPAFTYKYSFDFGPLAPNTYTYEVYFAFPGFAPELQSRQTLVVAAAPEPIPTLSLTMLAVMGSVLAALGLFISRR